MSNRPIISMILAKSGNGVIGSNNKLPWHFKEDLQHFKKMTTGKTVIMGRKTWESIPVPLKDRLVLVVTSNPVESYGCKMFSSFDEALDFAKKVEPKEVVIAGGSSIYKQGIDHASIIYETIINDHYEGDTYFTVKDMDMHLWNYKPLYEVIVKGTELHFNQWERNE